MSRMEPFLLQEIQMNKSTERPALLAYVNRMPDVGETLQIRSSGCTSALRP